MLKKIEYDCEIVKAVRKNEYVDFLLKNKELCDKCYAGGFLHIDCSGDTYLRRPISIAEAENGYVRIIFQIKGKGTALLAEKKEGDKINVLGPLGHGFDVKNYIGKKVVLVGGGLGSFPLIYLARIFKSNASFILGFRNRELVYPEKDFEKDCHTYIMTDDGSMGQRGFTTDKLRELIASQHVDAVMTCGPEIMMKKIAEICIENNIPCQVSLEERMGCGIGTCLCCVRDVNINGAKERLCVCKEGPVFDAVKVYKQI